MPDTHRDRTGQARWLFVAIALGLAVLHGAIFELAARRIVTWQPSRELFGALRSFGPALAALIAATYLGGASGVRALRDRIVRVGARASTYGFILLGPVVAILVAMAVTYRLHPDAFVRSPIHLPRLILIFFVLPFVDGPLGEEIGWRGFFLPALLQRYGAVVSSLIVGLVWFLWHLPLYHADGISLSVTMLSNYFLFVTALSCLHTWIFLRSRHSGFVAIVFHNTTNYVVLVSVTIFPMLRDLETFEKLYDGIAIACGVVAACALFRTSGELTRGRVVDPIIDPITLR